MLYTTIVNLFTYKCVILKQNILGWFNTQHDARRVMQIAQFLKTLNIVFCKHYNMYTINGINPT